MARGLGRMIFGLWLLLMLGVVFSLIHCYSPSIRPLATTLPVGSVVLDNDGSYVRYVEKGDHTYACVAIRRVRHPALVSHSNANVDREFALARLQERDKKNWVLVGREDYGGSVLFIFRSIADQDVGDIKRIKGDFLESFKLK